MSQSFVANAAKTVTAAARVKSVRRIAVFGALATVIPRFDALALSAAERTAVGHSVLKGTQMTALRTNIVAEVAVFLAHNVEKTHSVRAVMRASIV